jgi:chromosome segregation ATPase
MYSKWQPSPSHLNQPIQLWQLEDAHHAVRLVEKRLADAEHAYARETEQLYTTIAAYEHSALARESSIRDLQGQVKLLKQELTEARAQYEKAITAAEKRISEMSVEYAAETKRMREVVSDHQRTAAERESARTDLANQLVHREAAIEQLKQQASDLNDRLDEKTRVLADVDVNAKEKLADAEKSASDQQAEVQRLRVQLDETETQHRADVETLRQTIAELELTAPDQAQTIQDLSQLSDQRSAELAEALELAAVADSELSEARSNHQAEIELYQEEMNSKDETITLQQSEVERLAAELEAKQAELDEVAQMSDSIDMQLNDAVDAHSEQVAAFEAAMAAKEQNVSDRKTELRALAQRTFRRETQFKQIVTDLRSEATQTLQETIAGYEAETEQLRGVITTLEESGSDREDLIHELKQQVEQLETSQRELAAQYGRESADLQQSSAATINQVRSELTIQVHQLQSELQITTSQLQTTQDELSRTRTALQTTAQDQSINSVQAAELVAELTTKANDLQNQLASVQQQHDLSQEQSQNSIAGHLAEIESANQKAATLTQQLAQSASENQKLVHHFKIARSKAAKYQKRASYLSKRLRDVIEVQRRIRTNPETLKRFRNHVEQLNQQISDASQASHKSEFTVTQLNRTIAWLEHTSESLQDSLQREAAARRKAESILKQLAEDEEHPAPIPSVAQSAAMQIEADERINRLTRELDATRKMRLIERKQALAELKRLSEEIAKQESKNTLRRAA